MFSAYWVPYWISGNIHFCWISLVFLFKLSKFWSEVRHIMNICSAFECSSAFHLCQIVFSHSLSSRTHVKCPTWLGIFPSKATHPTTSYLLFLFSLNEFCQRSGFTVPLLLILGWRKPDDGPLGCFASSEKRETFHQTVKALNSAPSLWALQEHKLFPWALIRLSVCN